MPSIINVVGAPAMLVLDETATVCPTEIVMISPGLGTAPQDQIEGSLQFPLDKETQVAAVDVKVVTINAIKKMNFFMGFRFRGSITKTYSRGYWLSNSLCTHRLIVQIKSESDHFPSIN